MFSPQIMEGAKPSTSAQQGSHLHHETLFQDDDSFQLNVDDITLKDYEEPRKVSILLWTRRMNSRGCREN